MFDYINSLKKSVLDYYESNNYFVFNYKPEDSERTFFERRLSDLEWFSSFGYSKFGSSREDINNRLLDNETFLNEANTKLRGKSLKHLGNKEKDVLMFKYAWHSLINDKEFLNKLLKGFKQNHCKYFKIGDVRE